jgi:uncharacterized protein (TIGR03437 family)
VIIDGSRLPTGAAGLKIASSDNVIRGLQIVNFPGDAIVILAPASNNVVGGDRNRGRGPMGQGNLISANRRGLLINGTGADNNVVAGNWFGLDVRGSAWVPNQGSCLVIAGGAKDNRIGGPTPGERNVFAGCVSPSAVLIVGEGTTGNRVVGNYLGTDPTGTRRMPPEGCATYSWLHIAWGARQNIVGGHRADEGNVLSGACGPNVSIDGVGTTGNLIAGNYIGTDATGTRSLGQSLFGVWLDFGAQGNVIRQNVISGNRGGGVAITARGCEFNIVAGNLVGPEATGLRVIGNASGIYVALGARFNLVGGTRSGEGNVISGNQDWNVWFGAYDDESNFLIGNYVGTDVTGKRAIADSERAAVRGVVLFGKPWGTMIEGNLVGGNPGPGIMLEGAGVQNVYIGANNIGVDASGREPVSNLADGIHIWYSQRNVIQNNLVAYNLRDGIRIENGAYNTLRANRVFLNSGRGISVLFVPADLVPPVPRLLIASRTGVWGAACSGCEVDVFSDDGDQARYFEGAAEADAGGRFSLRQFTGFTGRNLTAVATDPAGTSSEFSLPLSTLPSAGPLVTTSAASYRPGAISPDSIVAAFGPNLVSNHQAAARPLPTSLGGVTVAVRDAGGGEHAALLYYVSPGQVNFVMPGSVVYGMATVRVRTAEGNTFTDVVEVVPVAPGLFTADGSGRGRPAGVFLRVRPDGTQAYEPAIHPADLGSENDRVYLLLFGTGIRGRHSLDAVKARVGGLEVPVLYAGPQPEYPGLDQLNLLLPPSLKGRGETTIEVSFDGHPANPVNIFVR